MISTSRSLVFVAFFIEGAGSDGPPAKVSIHRMPTTPVGNLTGKTEMKTLKNLLAIVIDHLTPRATLLSVSEQEARARVAARGIRLY